MCAFWCIFLLVHCVKKTYLSSIDENGALQQCFEAGRNLFHGAHTPVASLTRQLASESLSKQAGNELCTRGLFLQLMAELLRSSEESSAEPKGGEPSQLVSRVLDHLSVHYREAISLDALAELFFVSKYHLSHQFSQSVGTSVYRYVLLKRLQHARQMLLNGSSPGEACRESGFQNYANFYRSFRSVYGISPQDAEKWLLNQRLKKTNPTFI